ncbi:MAG: DUF3488 and DUF4129 domain-containing transglutaminase family protein [Candidatus Methylacidiphilales bacterium]
MINSLGYHERINSASVYWLAACFAMAASTHLFYTSSQWMLVFAGSVLLWRCYAENHNKSLPKWPWIIVMAGIVFAIVRAQMSTIWGRDAGTTLMLGLVALKFLELRTRRDSMVVVLVCYFVCASALLFSQSIANAALVFLTLMLVTGCLVQLQFGRNGARQLLPVIRIGGMLSLQAVPLTVALFLLFPRITGHFGFDLGLARTGLPEKVAPGNIAKLTQSDEIAFRVDFPNTPPSQALMYWRAYVLPHLNGDTYEWSNDSIGKSKKNDREYRRELERRKTTAPLTLEVAERIRQRITIWPHGKKFYFALDHPVTAASPDVASLDRTTATLTQYSRDLQRKQQYTVDSEISRPSTDISPLMLDATMSYPANINPRIEALGESWRQAAQCSSWMTIGGLPLTWQERVEQHTTVQSALNYFAYNGFIYTTSPGRYDKDPIAQFLFDKENGRKGFCEHYASTFVLLMRTAGVPARLVAGYLGGEYNPYGRFYIVTQASAHAWAEVWIRGYGWMRVDPTSVVSPSRMSHDIEAFRRNDSEPLTITIAGERFAMYGDEWKPEWVKSFQDEISLRWQQLEQNWDEWILSYDSEMQLRIMQTVGFSRQFTPEQTMGVLFVLAALSAAVIHFLVKKKQIRLDPVAEIYQGFCRRLMQQGLERYQWEGPLDYGTRAALAFPTAGEAILTFTQRYAEFRFGPRAAPDAPAHGPGRPSSEAIRELRDLFARVKQHLPRKRYVAPPLAAMGSGSKSGIGDKKAEKNQPTEKAGISS